MHKNNVVFKSSPFNCNLYREVQAEAVANEFLFCASRSVLIKRRQHFQVRWNKREFGWMKFSTDGSSLGNPGMASGGGLIRDHKGSWVKGFTRPIGVAFSVGAKLWALRNGLRFCISLNLLAVEIEFDAKVVLGWVTKEFNSNLHHASLILVCRTLINQIPQV